MSPTRSGTDAVPAGAAPAVVRATAVRDALAASETGSMRQCMNRSCFQLCCMVHADVGMA